MTTMIEAPEAKSDAIMNVWRKIRADVYEAERIGECRIDLVGEVHALFEQLAEHYLVCAHCGQAFGDHETETGFECPKA